MREGLDQEAHPPTFVQLRSLTLSAKHDSSPAIFRDRQRLTDFRVSA
jgi:hypothetical protein